jgi:hypothetical protein
MVDDLDSVAADGGGYLDLIPREHVPGRQRDLLHTAVAPVGADEARIPVEQHELVTALELEERPKELVGLDPHPTPVLVVVAQHDPDTH